MKIKSLLLLTCILSISIAPFAQKPDKKFVKGDGQTVQLQDHMFPLPKDGAVYKIKNVKSGLYAQTQHASMNNGAVVQLGANSDEDHSKWKAIAFPGGFFKFKNVKSNKILAISNSMRTVNGIISQWDDNNQEDSRWLPLKTTKGYKLKNKNSNFVAGIEGGGKESGAKLLQLTDDGSADKDWVFEEVKVLVNIPTIITAPQNTTPVASKKILVDIILDNIGVSESTRNRIDNGDCKRVFGNVHTEIWELGADNEMKKQLASYNNMKEEIFTQKDYTAPTPVAYSYHQESPSSIEMGRVTYNIPEDLLQQRKIMLVVKTNIGTRHKDNDLASYDCLGMAAPKESTFILSAMDLNGGKRTVKMVQVNTDLLASDRAMHFLDVIVPVVVFRRTDDTHKMWLNIAVVKK